MVEPVTSGTKVIFESRGRTVSVELPRDALKALQMNGVVVALYNWAKVRKNPLECLGNVMAFDSEGNLAWEIEPFQWHEGSFYTGLWSEDGKLWAYADPGYTVEVDPGTGKILSSAFTK